VLYHKWSILQSWSQCYIVMPLENFLWKCSMGYTLYPWISLLEPVRATGVQDSRRILSYITVCDYDTTYLQENPQRLG